MGKKSYQTIVVKIGSSTLTTPQGEIDHANLERIAAEAAQLVQQGKKVILVTSGAIATGASQLKLGQPTTIPEKQAAAAVGQSRLMRQYEKAFEKHNLIVAQILLTRDVITTPARSVNAKHCLLTLLREGVVPVVNENDTVAIDEIKIGDNDNLAALTARLVGADLLILLTDVDGFYINDMLVPQVGKIDARVKKAAGQAGSRQGTGGMVTKLQAARICRRSKIDMAIVHGKKAGLIISAAAGQPVGTFFV
ncbi:glutamate 5-kinase [candidate division WOR-1 bacterium RIFOXYB2_FULL_48_7]|uniref:Glutamate 5-kinase n=1 Tax=candidate division WOR-1 bacterium RIFOXYB2_FULL_48_7 TaxID=1802583 RepID=A0A1F4TI46_UNCSA|nr:MAG: glutamate 5-kinase [candidate division WOR-1 bacterium RIFOXYB2_FULL_48_7]